LGAKSKRKGNRNELELAKILSKRFGREFSRSIGSGNRWSQTSLNPDQSKVFAGDLVCPAGFRFAIECKAGYDEVNIFSLNQSAKIDMFLNQAVEDSVRCSKLPLLCWKQSRQPWIVFLKEEVQSPYQYRYGDWSVVLLDDLLGREEEFFYLAP